MPTGINSRIFHRANESSPKTGESHQTLLEKFKSDILKEKTPQYKPVPRDFTDEELNLMLK